MAHPIPKRKTLGSYEKGFKDKAKAPGDSLCVCGSALNCQYCTRGYSKNNPSNVHPLWREWDNLWGWWDVEKERSFRRWEMKYMNPDGLWGSPKHKCSLWSLDVENWKKKCLKKASSLGEPLGFSHLCFITRWAHWIKTYLFCKKGYGYSLVMRAKHNKPLARNPKLSNRWFLP